MSLATRKQPERKEDHGPSLERVCRSVRVQLLTYAVCSEHPREVLGENGKCPVCTESRSNRKGHPVTCYFIYEPFETIGVFGKRRGELRDLLIAWRCAGKRNSLVEFAGRRGFHIKCVRNDD